MRLRFFGFLVLLFAVSYVLSTVLREAGLLVVLVGLAAGLVVLVRRTTRGANTNNRGLALLTEGRMVEARAAFEAAARDMWGNPLPRYNTAFADLWLWRLEEARVTLEATTTVRRGKPLRVMGAPALLLIAALQNDQARATVLEQEVATLKLDRSAVAAMAQAVWHARGQRWQDVLDTLSLERTRPLGGSARAVADALRAWAAVQLGRPCPPIDTVGVFGETGPATVRAWWPEFADFLERQAQPLPGLP